MIELTDIERDVQTYRSKIGDLRRQTRDCMFFGPNGETNVMDPERLKVLTTEMTKLEGQLDHSSQILAKASALMGDRKAADIETSKEFAQNRITGIKARLWHDLMELIVPKIEIEQSIRGDLIFYQAGEGVVTQVLRSPEFEELKAKAEQEVISWYETIVDCTKLLEQFQAITQDKQPPKTKKQQPPTIDFDVEKLCKQNEPLMSIGLAGVAALSVTQSRQKEAGLVEDMGPIVLDGKLLKPNQIYLIELTPEILSTLNNGWLCDLGVRIPVGYRIRKDGVIVAQDKH
jgi:hypothetical protein